MMNMSYSPFVSSRRRLLDAELRGAGITDERVIAAVQAVPRELFVSSRPGAEPVHEALAVACALQALCVRPTYRVLEVGLRTGYTAAVLSFAVAEVFALATNATRAEAARERLAAYGYARIAVKAGDALTGWPGAGPYDGILLAGPQIDPSPSLRAQLAPGARIITITPSRVAESLHQHAV